MGFSYNKSHEEKSMALSISPLSFQTLLLPCFIALVCLCVSGHTLSSQIPRQFLFVVAFTTFLVSCVDYDILFANKMVNHSLHPTEPIKVTLPDAFLPAQVCSAR